MLGPTARSVKKLNFTRNALRPATCHVGASLKMRLAVQMRTAARVIAVMGGKKQEPVEMNYLGRPLVTINLGAEGFIIQM